MFASWNFKETSNKSKHIYKILSKGWIPYQEYNEDTKSDEIQGRIIHLKYINIFCWY
jgi:hypothetical protein